MDLSIVIVNYQTFELTRDTINSILKYDYSFNYEILVVDNASSDDSLSRLQDYFKDKQVKFIASIENNGFAAGNNQAIAIAKGRYVLLLNSDTVVWENTLNDIYEYMEKHRDVGAAGCRVLLENCELDKACKRSFPNVKNSFFRLFHVPTKSKDDNYNLDDLPDDEIYEIDCLTGAFMFIRKDALNQVGLLDETFFMYGEDIDLCFRIKKAGWKIIYYGKSKITHLKGASSKKQKSKLIYEFYRAMYIYYKKHHAHESFFITNIVVYFGIFVLCVLKLFLNLFKKKD
ncbi:glycosyltransferase family 2 protein [uncultured Methanobrevibacter sp.]|uniref:glycosyltransferase family 2 protein n=1 Tax=uncultured Methanobrevibacter sp. TaxID=253161 RepID=UPI0025D8EFA5|nr:glycosyltransferase family 2 protein [uncultured Methanobrevibacter sp.]